MNTEQALKWCHENSVTVQFFTSHVEICYGSSCFSEVEFIDAVNSLIEYLEN
jgi:hypothetical protein